MPKVYVTIGFEMDTDEYGTKGTEWSVKDVIDEVIAMMRGKAEFPMECDTYHEFIKVDVPEGVKMAYNPNKKVKIEEEEPQVLELTNNKPKKKGYFAIAYGHVIRWAGPCLTPTQAAIQAFGYADAEKMTVRRFPSNPRYMAQYKRREFQDALAKRHKEKTGSIIA